MSTRLKGADVVIGVPGLPGPGSATNLTTTLAASSVTINSDTGTDATIPAADGTNAGLMLPASVVKLNGIAAGAEVNVNADWAATTGDAAILNVPATFPPSAHGHNQSSSHGSPDTDSAATALHHTLGVGANQAAAGNHTHTQAQSHDTPDTDSAPTALHHTLGTGANQAAPGNHRHPNQIAIIPMVADAVTWTNMPAAETEFGGLVAQYRTRYDLSIYTEIRLVAAIRVAGTAAAVLQSQYFDSATSAWVSFGPLVSLATVTSRSTAWEALPVAVRFDAFLRIVGRDGDGVADPVTGNIFIQVR